jgi:hypothetical protein
VVVGGGGGGGGAVVVGGGGAVVVGGGGAVDVSFVVVDSVGSLVVVGSAPESAYWPWNGDHSAGFFGNGKSVTGVP